MRDGIRCMDGREALFQWWGMACLLCASLVAGQEFRPLTDGKTAKGWSLVGDGALRVENGILIMTHPATSDVWGHVVSDSSFDGDFTLRFSFKLVKGNSGLAFHSFVGSVSGMYGPQAELENTSPGGLLMTYPDGSPRPWAWIQQPSAKDVKSFFKPGDWNLMTITSKGKRVTITCNGFTSADTSDAQFPAKGHFGIQLHKIVDTEIQVKDLLLATLPTVSLAAKPRRLREPGSQWLYTLDGRLGGTHLRSSKPSPL